MVADVERTCMRQTLTAVGLQPHPNKSCTGAMLQAPVGNTGIVKVGSSAATCYIELTKGDPPLWFPFTNLNEIYALSATPGDFLVIYFFQGPILP